MSNTNPIPVDQLETLECLNGIDKIKKASILKLDNRKRLAQYVNVVRYNGFEFFVNKFSPDRITKEIVQEIISLA